jgi:hypothetical protein
MALFTVTNKSLFSLNSEIHNFNTRKNSNFFQVMAYLEMFHTSHAYADVKIYNHLPADIKIFKKALRNYLHVHSFYTMDEFVCIQLYKCTKWYLILLHNCIISVIMYY